MQRMIGTHIDAFIQGELPARQQPVLLCLGSAPDGVERAGAFLSHTAADVAACNDAITACPLPLHLAASLHAELLDGWVRGRAVQAPRPFVIGAYMAPGVDAVVGCNQAIGSSGMYLALLGQLMGYQRIVLAGIHLERPGETAYRDIWQGALNTGALKNVETLAVSGWLSALLKGVL